MSGKFWEDLLTSLYNVSMSQRDSTGQFHSVTCDYAGRRARFCVPYDLYQGRRHPCPTCRTGTASWWVSALGSVQAAKALPAKESKNP